MVHHTGIWCFLSDSIIFHRSDGANGLRHHQPEGCGLAAYTPPPVTLTSLPSTYLAYLLLPTVCIGKGPQAGGTSSICEGRPSSICLHEGRPRLLDL